MPFPSRDIEMKWSQCTPAPIHALSFFDGMSKVHLLRLDLLQSWASGNKYFKLKYVLKYALSHGCTSIVSKGGMFSNHLAALSEACHFFGIKCISVIRSHQPDEANPCIIRLREKGDDIIYLSPTDYKIFGEADAKQLFPEALFVPEGGLNKVGIRGASEIASWCISLKPEYIILPGGSMSTACGLLSALSSNIQLIIVPAWKGCTKDYLQRILDEYGIAPACSWEIWPDYHFGGFGKFDSSLVDFMSAFTGNTHIPLDPVYNGKLIYALNDKLATGYFPHNTSILAVHTGGLQGLDGYQYRFPAVWGKYRDSVR